MIVGVYLAFWLAIAAAIWWSSRKESAINRMHRLLGPMLYEPIVTVLLMMFVYSQVLDVAWKENLISITLYQTVVNNGVLDNLLRTASVVIAFLPLLMLFDPQPMIRSVAWQAGLIVLGRWLYLLFVRYEWNSGGNVFFDFALMLGYLIIVPLSMYVVGAKLRGRLELARSPLRVETEPLFQGQPVVYVDPANQPTVYADPPKDSN